MTDPVLRAIAGRCAGGVSHSAETGTGRTTLGPSHLSADHLVFAADDSGAENGSLARVRSSQLFDASNTRFVLGATQLTLPNHSFETSIDFALIDGPHGFPFPALEYYYLYPHIGPGGTLVLDDLQIRSIGDMARVLRADAMWHLDQIVDNAAFFTRTDAPTLDPLGDGWWEQAYNRMTLLRRVKKKLMGR